MKKFPKSDLKCGDVIVYKHKSKIAKVVDEKELSFINDHYDDELRALGGELEIISVYRKPLWKRENPTITNVEKVLLENISEEYNYIARDSATYLILFESKPIKKEKEWIRQPDTYFTNFYAYMHLFPMVKWEDEEPWLIKDLLRLPVKEGITWHQ